MAFLSGEAAGIIFEKTDEEIVNMCVDALQKLFPEEVINMNLFLYIVINTFYCCCIDFKIL